MPSAPAWISSKTAQRRRFPVIDERRQELRLSVDRRRLRLDQVLALRAQRVALQLVLRQVDVAQSSTAGLSRPIL